MRKKSMSRLDRSFLDISAFCLERARRSFGIKERGLVKMAENAIYYGMSIEDDDLSPNIKRYCRKLKYAFQSDLIFYLDANYVFTFWDGTLINIFPIHSFGHKHEVQEKFKSNKMNFESLDADSKKELQRYQQRNFEMSCTFTTADSFDPDSVEYVHDY